MNDKIIFALIIGIIIGGITVSIFNEDLIEESYWNGRMHTFQTTNVTIIENNTMVEIPIVNICQRIYNLNNQGGK